MSNLEELFDELIDQIVEQDFAVLDYFIPEENLKQLFQHLQHLYAAEEMKKAGIGQAVEHEVNGQIRGDQIKWLPRASILPFEIQFNKQVNNFCHFLNRSCFLSLNDYEFHYTCYPPTTFYKKHIDQFKKDNSRVLSLIIYLNKDWQAGDGGEVVLYPEGKNEVVITPNWGKVICFRSSEMPHEVLMTNKNRYSITGWLKSVNSGNLLQLID